MTTFYREEADRYIQMGILNAIFVFGRSAGLIGKSPKALKKWTLSSL